jgi:type IV pilus assembly protein PilE
MRNDCASHARPGSSGARGFTLIELMIAVAIVAILLSVAVPSYREYLRRGAVAEVIAAIGDGRVVLEQYYLDNRTYVGGPCPAGTQKFAIACVTTATTYTITATGAENMTDFVYTIDETNLRTTDGPWGTATCWITRKGESC